MHTNTKVIKYYFHSNKESNWENYVPQIWGDEIAEADWDEASLQALPQIKAAKDFRYLGYEVEAEVEVDLDTGQARYLSFSGVPLEHPTEWQ